MTTMSRRDHLQLKFDGPIPPHELHDLDARVEIPDGHQGAKTVTAYQQSIDAERRNLDGHRALLLRLMSRRHRATTSLERTRLTLRIERALDFIEASEAFIRTFEVANQAIEGEPT